MKTRLVEWFFYLRSGASVLDIFKNLVLGILGVYIALKFASPILLVVMFIVAIPALVFIGYYYVHHVAKISEKLSIKYGTFYSIKQFELMEEQVRLLKSIEKRLTPPIQNKR